MARTRRLIVLLCLWVCAPAFAGSVHLVDGSLLKGHVVALGEQTLILDTTYAGSLHVKRDALLGITTADQVRVTLSGGDVVLARLSYAPDMDVQRMVVDGATRVLSLDTAALRIACMNCAASMPAGVASTITATSTHAEAPEFWSGAIKFGLNGNAGNTETRSLQLGFTALRDVGDRRLLLTASLDRQVEDDEVTADEIRGKVRYEYDFTSRMFGYVMERLSHDEFNQIKLRSRTTFGLGYYMVRNDTMSFKIRGGLGYKHETFTDEHVDRDGIVGFGWDYWQLVGGWLELRHEFTIFHEVTDSPTDNFTIDSVLGAQVPIADSDAWSVTAQLTHEYRNDPQPGVERLDTSYMLGVVREFE